MIGKKKEEEDLIDQERKRKGKSTTPLPKLLFVWLFGCLVFFFS
jgi:hypothetical protein